MILVFQDKNIREEFESKLEGACVYRRIESELFGDKVSTEDYVNRALYGASIPFYKEVFRKRVAQNAIDHEYVILDTDPSIPDEVAKCPVIYITDRTEGNDEEFGQLPVKYAGSVEKTMEAADEMMRYWLDKYGEGRAEKEFYKDFLDAAIARIPEKIRIIAVRRLADEYVAGVVVNFDDENVKEIEELISKVEEEFNLAPFVDSDIDRHFNIEDYYFTILWGDSPEQFLEICRDLRETNEKHREEVITIYELVDNNAKSWAEEMYHTIYQEHIKEKNDYKKIPSGYIQIFYKTAYKELCFWELGIEEEKDDVVFLTKVLEYLGKKLTEALGETFELRLYFYGGEKLKDLLP